MKMVDRLLAMTPSHIEDISHAQKLLKLPQINHARCDLADVGLVDRFVLSDGFVEAFDNEVAEFAHMKVLFKSSRTLLSQFWLEHPAGAAGETFGYLIDNGIVRCYLFDGRFDNQVHYVCSFFFDEMRDAITHLDAETVRFDGTARIHIAPFFKSMIGRGYLDRDEILQCVRIIPICAVIANSRTAVTRRLAPSTINAAERAALRRRFQRGRPMFSYNRVGLVLPKTCFYRGELKPIEAFEGVRGHMVIGHWRLIDLTAEPFWIWIDGHERGNRERGWIVKERCVQFNSGPPNRRGFIVPIDPGKSRERRAAVRA